MLSGLGSETFNDAIAGIYTLQSLLAAHVPAQTLIPWAPSFYQEHLSIDLANRYFSRRKDVLEPAIPFGDGVDPHGILNSLMQDDLVHTSDNEVLFYQRLDSNVYASPLLQLIFTVQAELTGI